MARPNAGVIGDDADAATRGVKGILPALFGAFKVGTKGREVRLFAGCLSRGIAPCFRMFVDSFGSIMAPRLSGSYPTLSDVPMVLWPTSSQGTLLLAVSEMRLRRCKVKVGGDDL